TLQGSQADFFQTLGAMKIAFKAKSFSSPDYGGSTSKQQRKGQNKFNQTFKIKFKKSVKIEQSREKS
ncbi:MAG TPA: hypothetical protein DCY15_02430, partial [Ruminococcaceae bacterium]|nr:hypothetical protein [Oscillospiraceae bacterium]